LQVIPLPHPRNPGPDDDDIEMLGHQRPPPYPLFG
jgi:hypothetical protein